jgi:hypothetical protein
MRYLEFFLINISKHPSPSTKPVTHQGFNFLRGEEETKPERDKEITPEDKLK